MLQKGVVFGVLILFIFCTLTWADSKPNLSKEDEPAKKADGVGGKSGGVGLEAFEEEAGEIPVHLDDPFRKHCCAWDSNDKCVKRCAGAQEATALEAFEEEAGEQAVHLDDQFRKYCCQWGRPNHKKCVKWCTGA